MFTTVTQWLYSCIPQFLLPTEESIRESNKESNDTTISIFPVVPVTDQITPTLETTSKIIDLINPDDIDKILPQEVNNDWFEVTPEPITVKNRHLINISGKPINPKDIDFSKIGMKLNTNFDLRSSPQPPKNVISPWLKTNVLPDENIKPLY